MLEISRGVQGVGGAIMFADSLAILGNAFRGKDQGIAFGIWGAITAIAAAVGPIVGGAIVTGIGWRYIFFLNIPIAVAAGTVSLARIAESARPPGRLAGRGAVHRRAGEPGIRPDRV
jgi:MFS family permease